MCARFVVRVFINGVKLLLLVEAETKLCCQRVNLVKELISDFGPDYLHHQTEAFALEA